MLGFSDPYGGFSEYSLADPRSSVKLPDGISFDSAAPLFCAGVTAYSAILRTRSKPGQLINIIGCGGVGHIAIKFAKAMGYRVHAYDISQDKLDLARRCGADGAFNSRTLSPDFEKAPSTIVISGVLVAYDAAFSLTSNHGAVIAVGLPPDKFGINVALWASKDIAFIPSSTGSKQDLVELLDLAVRHNIQPLTEIRSIESINEAYQDLMSGKIDGRILFRFT